MPVAVPGTGIGTEYRIHTVQYAVPSELLYVKGGKNSRKLLIVRKRLTIPNRRVIQIYFVNILCNRSQITIIGLFIIHITISHSKLL